MNFFKTYDRCEVQGKKTWNIVNSKRIYDSLKNNKAEMSNQPSLKINMEENSLKPRMGNVNHIIYITQWSYFLEFSLLSVERKEYKHWVPAGSDHYYRNLDLKLNFLTRKSSSSFLCVVSALTVDQPPSYFLSWRTKCFGYRAFLIF